MLDRAVTAQVDASTTYTTRTQTCTVHTHIHKCAFTSVCPQVCVGSTSLPQVSALYGIQSGQQRAATLADFNSGRVQVLFTTDAFGLGLDYQGVDVVINYKALAPSLAAYVAR